MSRFYLQETYLSLLKAELPQLKFNPNRQNLFLNSSWKTNKQTNKTNKQINKTMS